LPNKEGKHGYGKNILSIHIGASGWSYDHWNGVLYPHGLPAADRLERYVQSYQTVEVNSTSETAERDQRNAPSGRTSGKLKKTHRECDSPVIFFVKAGGTVAWSDRCLVIRPLEVGPASTFMRSAIPLDNAF